MKSSNLKMLQTVVKSLCDLRNELVFVGGCTTRLLITDEVAEEIRITKDVDAIIEAASYAQHSLFAEKLKQLRFNRRHARRRAAVSLGQSCDCS